MLFNIICIADLLQLVTETKIECEQDFTQNAFSPSKWARNFHDYYDRTLIKPDAE